MIAVIIIFILFAIILTAALAKMSGIQSRIEEKQGLEVCKDE